MNEKKYYTNEKKRFYFIPMLLLSIVLLFGTTFAYFSDVVDNITEANTSTLKITSEYSFYLNGEETTKDKINALNPGDVVLVKFNITNEGNQSAWIRERFVIDCQDETILEYFTILDGEYTKESLLNLNDHEDNLLSFSNGACNLPNKVINGSGDFAEIESGVDYNYLESSTYQKYLTIYFLPTATNEAQGKSFNLIVTTQALQFRNNNLKEPDDLMWGTL